MARMRRKFADRNEGIMNPRLRENNYTAGRETWRPGFEQTGNGAMRMNIPKRRQENIPYSAGRMRPGDLYAKKLWEAQNAPESHESIGGGTLGDWRNQASTAGSGNNWQMAELITKGNPGLTQGSNWNWVPGIDYDVPSDGAKGLDAIRGLYNNRVYGKNFRSTVGSVPGNIGDPGISIEDIIQTVPAGWQQNFRDVQGIGGFQDPQDVYDQMLYMQQQGNFVV